MDENTKRKLIRKYFKEFPSWAVILLVVGVLILWVPYFNFLFGIPSIIIGIVGLIVGLSGRPSDSQIDDWLESDQEELIARSKVKLALDDSLIISDPYKIFVWIMPGDVGTYTTPEPGTESEQTKTPKYGIPVDDVKQKRGKAPCKYKSLFSNYIRHSAWRFQIFYPTEHYLGSYGCWFDFLRGKYVNETSQEIFYKDVTILETGTADRINAQRQGLKESDFEIFTLKVSSGDSIEVRIPSESLINQTLRENLTEVPSTQCEKMVQSMRKMIQAKKS